MSNSNKCDDFAELLDAYHDAELTAADRHRVEEHLLSCKLCQEKLSNISSLAIQLKALPMAELSRDIVGSLDFNFDFDFEPSFEFGTAVSEMHAGDRLDAYHDGELSAGESLELERHIANCSDCAHKLSQIEHVVQGLKKVPKLEASRDIVAGLTFSCDPVVLLLDAYHDNELDSNERKKVDEHLAVCAVCSESLVKISRVVGGLKSLPVLEPARDIVGSLNLPAELATSVPISVQKNTDSSSRVVPIRKGVWAGLGAVAAAAVVLIFAVSQNVIEPSKVASKNGPEPSHLAEKASSAATYSDKPAENAPVENPDTGIATATDTSWPIESRPEIIAEKGKNQLAPNVANSNGSAKSKSGLAQSSPVKNADNVAVVQIASTQDTNLRDTSLNELASLETNEGVADALGIATDEDGLYDIKI